MDAAAAAAPREPAPVDSQVIARESAVSSALTAASTTASVPVEAAVPTVNDTVVAGKGKRKRSVDVDGQRPPQPTEQDDETESEAEIECEAAAAPLIAAETVESRSETVSVRVEKGDESEEEEEEDEAFPPAPPLPSPTMASSVAVLGPVLEPKLAETMTSLVAEASVSQPSADCTVEPSVDVEMDEKLLGVLLSRSSQLTDAALSKAAWVAVTKELGGRFVDGEAAKVRVRWLLSVLHMPTHREWPRLSEPIKTLLTRVEAVRAIVEAEEKVAEAEEAEEEEEAETVAETAIQPGAFKRRKVVLDEQTYLRIEREKLLNKQLQQQQPPPLFQPLAPSKPPLQLASPASTIAPFAESASSTTNATTVVSMDTGLLPVLPKQHVKSVLNVALEEKIMAIVLKHAPMFLTAEQRNDVWDAIARDSRGRYESGASAKSHYVWLTKTVLNDPHHREYAKITPKLRSMCAKVQTYTAKRTKNKPKAVQKPATPSAAALASAAGTSAAALPEALPPKQTTDKAVVVKAESTTLTVAPEYDEVLMEQFLLKRPFDYDRYAKPAVWREIAAIVPDPRVVSGVYGQKRVSWLADVFRNPADKEYTKLTPKLRKLLQEYTDMLASGEAVSKRLLGPTRKREIEALIGSNAAAAATPPVVAAASVPQDVHSETTATLGGQAETIATQRPRRQITKRVFDEYVTMDGSSDEDKHAGHNDADRHDDDDDNDDDDVAMLEGEATEASPFVDEVLIREILRVRPFHRKRGEGMHLWGSVQAAVARQIGSAQVFPTAERCWMRMRKLLSVVRNPKGTARVAVASGQVEMLQLLDTVIKTKWPLTAHRLKNEHHALLHKIDAMLQRPFASKPTHETSDSSYTETHGVRDAGPALGFAASEDQDNDEFTQELWRDEDDDDEDDKLEPPVPLTPQQIDALRVLGPELLEVFQSGLSSSQEAALRPMADVAASAIAASADAAANASAKPLAEQLQLCVRQLEVQSSVMAQARVKHRAEVKTLVEMLKEERARHQRETEALLAVVKQEREDRKSEFVAMMNLITRSVLPAEPPSHGPQ